jgi:hypothetical protein
MQNKPGPRKKPGERYPSGDLKPTVAPALWGRVRRAGDSLLRSELARLCFNRELTETQAETGFLIADVCRCSDSEESAKECTDAALAATRGDLHATQKDRKAIDALLSEYSPKVREVDADGIARLVDEFIALRDREEFRQEKTMQR